MTENPNKPDAIAESGTLPDGTRYAIGSRQPAGCLADTAAGRGAFRGKSVTLAERVAIEALAMAEAAQRRAQEALTFAEDERNAFAEAVGTAQRAVEVRKAERDQAVALVAKLREALGMPDAAA